jgi:hypothetical protein
MFSLGLNGIAKTCRCSSQPACLYTDKIFIPIRTKKGHRYVRRPFYMEQRESVRLALGAGHPAPLFIPSWGAPGSPCLWCLSEEGSSWKPNMTG